MIREQPPRMSKNSNSKMKSDSAIGQHLSKDPECGKTYSDDNFRIIGQDHTFIKCFGIGLHKDSKLSLV